MMSFSNLFPSGLISITDSLAPGEKPGLVSHLPSAVAALAAQVLAMRQQAGGTGALQGQPWVDEGRGTTIVIHKERLRRETEPKNLKV